MSALDASDPALATAFKEVSEVKSDKNWLLYTVEGTKLTLDGVGSGGHSELAGKFSSKKVHFGVLKVVGKDVRKNVESLRNKLVFFTYIGSEVGAVTKAKVSVQRPFVEKIVNSYAIRLDIGSDESSFDKVNIAKELLRCGGAHTPTHYVFGPGDEISVEELK